ncbi:MAG: hypothetical protein ACMUHB_00290 [Thermoplasmatota archaeon]|jgi:hypothetical protein
MTPRTITIYRIYQISSHRTLGFYTGDEEAVVKFCNLKYDVEMDDIALERVPVRQVSKSEVVCFSEVLDQLREHRQRIQELEDQADMVGMKEDIEELLEESC